MEHEPRAENGILVLSSEQVAEALHIADCSLSDFMDNRYSWSSFDSTISSIQRVISDTGMSALLGTTISVDADSDTVHMTRHLLDTDAGIFATTVTLYQSGDTYHATPTEEDARDFDLNLELNPTTPEDWTAFLLLLTEGADHLATIRSLEKKLGAHLGKTATTRQFDE